MRDHSGDQRKGCAAGNYGTAGAFNGWDYTDDEREFMLTMDRWKRERHRPYPDCRDILAVARSLGYRKVEG